MKDLQEAHDEAMQSIHVGKNLASLPGKDESCCSRSSRARTTTVLPLRQLAAPVVRCTASDDVLQGDRKRGPGQSQAA